jgi:hypothetical protein
MKIKSTIFPGDANPIHSEVELEVCTLKDGPVLRARIDGNLRYFNLDRSQFLQLACDLINAVNDGGE